MRHRAKAFGPLVRQKKSKPRNNNSESWYSAGLSLPEGGASQSENIRLTSTAEPVTTVVSNTNAGYSSTPDPAHAQPDSIESDERREYESSREEETPEDTIIFPQTKVTT